MKPYICLMLLLGFLLHSCNTEESESETMIMAEAIGTITDSVQIVQTRNGVEDTVLAVVKGNGKTVSVTLPAEKSEEKHVVSTFDIRMFDSATIVKFRHLAKATGGDLKLLINSRQLTRTISNIITTRAEDNTNVLFLIDKTGSMADELRYMKLGMKEIVTSLEKHENVQLSVALYGDIHHDKKNWFSYQDFGNDYKGVRKFIDTMAVTGGGDTPESVYDGFFAALQRGFWEAEGKKIIILIGDAPPLEKPQSYYSLQDVISKSREGKIAMNFYPIIVTPYAYEAPEIDTIPVKMDTSIKEDSLILKLYPNPCKGMLNVTFGEPDNYTIELYSVSGKLMHTEVFYGMYWGKDLSEFTNGGYIFHVRTKSGFETKNFILQRR